MKRFLVCIVATLFLLSGCSAVGDKNVGLSVVYGVAAVLSLLLLVACLVFVRKNRLWFIILFSSVLVVNVGYTLLSVSTSLEMALWANRLSYLGSVFLPFSMLMILLGVTNTPYRKRLPWVLFALSVVIFLIAASPGILTVYYKEVFFAVVDGASTLVKVYGPLHPLFLVYLLGYFASMIGVIVHGWIKKTLDTLSHAVILVIAVFVNLGMWFLEQLVPFDFEFLSISYIISELFLLGVHLVMKEHQRLRELVRQVESSKSTEPTAETPPSTQSFPPERMEVFLMGLDQLTPTEKEICNAYLARLTTKEIMARMNIKETTLKYHNRNLYGKLGVSSRKELLELHKQIQSVKSNLQQS
ncbi:MAG: hypothetical protein J6M34_04005 [Clostridia bacterium]|nr:hypothetical protein [Clostridia bacterium]